LKKPGHEPGFFVTSKIEDYMVLVATAGGTEDALFAGPNTAA